ncbi:Essential protein Yae1, N terminal [Neopestalotiopsis sp. 37M]|nr:Essential protein Yae1, N terminal [Neopestalotiopsis sp. 37M]
MHMAQQNDLQDEDLRIQIISARETPRPVVIEEDFLDDVFGSDAGSAVFDGSEHGAEARESHPSDIRRLQAEHTTTGYRDGITAAKAISIQAGFDEGFGLGANIGLKAGQVLGFLEGITSALRAADRGDDDGGAEDVYRESLRLLEEARKELSTESIYDEQYWLPDGTWRFELPSATAEGDIVFEDIASAHPLVRKWNDVVEEQLSKWSVDVQILQYADAIGAASAPEKKEIKLEQQARVQLDW